MPGRKVLAAIAMVTVSMLVAASGEDVFGSRVSDAANQLMQTTKVIAVTNITDPAKFVPDTDPNTLQIVYIPDPSLGKNHISEDGEVIWFFGDPNVNDQQAYIFKAFEIRAKLRQGKQ